jgi:uncharacterized iron-regulated membrane protein
VLAGLTGSVIAFQRELDAWLNPELFTQVGSGPALGLDALATRVEHQLPAARVVAIQPPVGFVRSALLRVEPAIDGATLDFDEVYADPATGRVLGTRLWGACCLQRERVIPFVFKLHYTLHLPGQWGMWLLGAVALLWALDCVIALLITAPRGGRVLEGWRRAASIKRGAGPQRRTFDLHRAPGLWLWPALLLIAISGVALNLKDEVFTPLVSVFSPVTPPLFEQPVPERAAPASRSFEAAAARAEQLAGDAGVPGKAAYVLHAPGLHAFGVAVAAPGQRDPRAGLGPSWVFVDDRDGALRSLQVPGRGSGGDVVTQLQYPLHTGLLLGLPGQILISLAGFVTALLSITGVLIWRLKRRASGLKLGRGAAVGRSAAVATA